MENINKIKVWLAVFLVILGAVAYQFAPLGFTAKLGALAGLVLAAVGVLWFSTLRTDFFAYVLDSYKEARKVVWPSKKETWQTTLIVFAFVGVLSLFMYLVDWALTKLIFGLVLGH